MTVNREPAQIGSELLIAAVNAVADLPFPVMVWTVFDALEVPDHVQVTTGDTVLASIPFERAEELGPAAAAIRLGRMARRAYESGMAPGLDTEPDCHVAEPG
jgi:hypothetical protein